MIGISDSDGTKQPKSMHCLKGCKNDANFMRKLMSS